MTIRHPAHADLDDLRVVGVSLAHPDTASAEHWLAALPVVPVLACTHVVQNPRPQVALSLAFHGTVPEGLGPESPEAAAEHLARRSGRAVLYPGMSALVGTLTVGEIMARSAIARVEVLGGGEAEPDALVSTGGFVRPQWRAGVLTLTTMPAAGERLVPFETRNPTPCCAAH